MSRPMSKPAPKGAIDSLLGGEELEFSFIEGLLGFGSFKQFTLSRYKPADGSESPFFLLQSKEDDICFPVVSPHLLLSDYNLAPSAEILSMLECKSADELLVLLIVTLRERLEEITVNLQGPIVLNPLSRLGLQLIVEDLPVRYPLLRNGRL